MDFYGTYKKIISGPLLLVLLNVFIFKICECGVPILQYVNRIIFFHFRWKLYELNYMNDYLGDMFLQDLQELQVFLI